MNTIIALSGKKMFLGIIGVSLVAGGIYVGTVGGRSAGVPKDTSKGIPSTTTDSSYKNTQWNDAVGGTKGMPSNWPKDLPVALAGATLMSSLTKDLGTGKMNPSVIYFTDTPVGEVIEYYIQSLSKNGWKVEANVDSAGYRIITAKKDTRAFSAFISSDPKTKKTGVTSEVVF